MSGGSCAHSNKSNRPRSRKTQCFRKDDQKYQKVSVVRNGGEKVVHNQNKQYMKKGGRSRLGNPVSKKLYIADFSAFSIFTLMTWIEFLSS